jgi:hypothetical protein
MVSSRNSRVGQGGGTQFTCFTSTKVQVLTRLRQWGLFERSSEDSYSYHLAPHISCQEQPMGDFQMNLEDKVRQLR